VRGQAASPICVQEDLEWREGEDRKGGREGEERGRRGGGEGEGKERREGRERERKGGKRGKEGGEEWRKRGEEWRREGREGGKGGKGVETHSVSVIYPGEHQPTHKYNILDARYWCILKSAPAYPLKNVVRDGEVFLCCAAATREFVLVWNGIR